jgi:hypothetical protein
MKASRSCSQPRLKSTAKKKPRWCERRGISSRTPVPPAPRVGTAAKGEAGCRSDGRRQERAFMRTLLRRVCRRLLVTQAPRCRVHARCLRCCVTTMTMRTTGAAAAWRTARWSVARARTAPRRVRGPGHTRRRRRWKGGRRRRRYAPPKKAHVKLVVQRRSSRHKQGTNTGMAAVVCPSRLRGLVARMLKCARGADRRRRIQRSSF